MKRSTFPLAMTLAVAALGHLPRTLLRFTFAANDKRQRIFISNLAGFEEATDFCGHQVENISMAAGIYVGNAGIYIYVGLVIKECPYIILLKSWMSCYFTFLKSLS